MIRQTIRSLLIGIMLIAPVGSAGLAADSDQFRAVAQSLVQAGMTESEANGLVRRMAESSFAIGHMEMIGQQVQAAMGQRATQQAVIGKIREGLAKQVGPAAIVAAIERVRERYGVANRTADSLLGGSSPGLGELIAEGMSSGLTRQDTEKIANGLQARMPGLGKDGQQALARETMITTRDMVRLGVSSQVAAEVMNAALAHGYDAAEMQVMRQMLNAQRMQGDINQVAKRFGEAISQGVHAGELGEHAGGSGGNPGGGGAGSGRDGSSGGGAGAGGSSGGGGPGGGKGGGGSGSGGGSGGSGSGSGGAGGGSGAGGSSGGGAGGGRGGGGRGGR